MIFQAFNSSVPTLIDFHASWCGPCKVLTPKLMEIVEKHDQEINLLMVDVDDFGDIAQEFDVSAIPCVKLVKEGGILGGFVGAKASRDIEEVIAISLDLD